MDLDLRVVAIADAIDVATTPQARRNLSRAYRDTELDFRLEAKRFKVGERASDGLAKLGGGSLLTAVIALIVGGQHG